jgi:hypothetical protein
MERGFRNELSLPPRYEVERGQGVRIERLNDFIEKREWV